MASLETLSDQSSRSTSPRSTSARLSPLTIIDHGTLSPLPSGSLSTSSSARSSPTLMNGLSAFAAEESTQMPICESKLSTGETEKVRGSDNDDQEIENQTHVPSKTCVSGSDSGLTNVCTDK